MLFFKEELLEGPRPKDLEVFYVVQRVGRLARKKMREQANQLQNWAIEDHA